jgi:uroporphyrinogen-III synthase
LPHLRSLRGRSVGLLAAPGGRGLIEPALRRRGANVRRADVYRRVEVAPSPLALARLRGLHARTWLALGSGEALRMALSRLPPELADKLRGADVAAASERLAQCARDEGFRGGIAIAASARPRDLVAAMAAAIG